MADIGDLCARMSSFIDGGYPHDLDGEAVLWRRITKVSSEANEARDALEGMLGENFRKGVTHTRQDVIGELLDTAFAALCAVEHMIGNVGDSMHLLESKAIAVTQRAGIQ